MDDDAAHGLEVFVRDGENPVHIRGRDVRIDPLQLQGAFDDVNAAKLTGHAHVDFRDAAVRLIFRFLDGR